MAIELTEQPRAAAPRAGAQRRATLRRRPLMHELIDCRLVERSPPGVWTLHGDVQGLLEQEYRAEDGVRRDRVFIGLRCEICGGREVTSLVNSRRICSSCASAHDAGPLPGHWTCRMKAATSLSLDPGLQVQYEDLRTAPAVPDSMVRPGVG